MREEAQEVVHENGRVDANEKIAHIPQNDRQVDVSEERRWSEFVEDVKWEWDNEAEQVCYCDPLVSPANGEEFGSHAPSDGERVELLDVLSTPNVGALDTYQDWSLILDDTKVSMRQLYDMFVSEAKTYVIIIT